MSTQLTITIDFQRGRKNPEEIFEAMALYIGFYKNFGQIIASSLDEKTHIETTLVDVHEGSIKAIIDFGKNIPRSIKNAIIKSSDKLAAQLVSTENIGDSTQLEDLAKDIDETIANLDGANQISPPKIDRKKFSKALLQISAANDRIYPEEVVTYSNDGVVIPINTTFKIASDAFSTPEGNIPSEIIEDIVTVIGPINIGDSPWQFESTALSRSFRAKILDEAWLRSYQNGLIFPIGPKDSLRISLEYKIIETASKKKQLTEFKVSKIKEIIRGKYEQESLDIS